MVETVTAIPNQEVAKRTSPLIVELVGPAGAGKSTLSRVLSQCYKNMVIGPDIQLRKMGHISIFIKNIPFVMPMYFYRGPWSRRFTWEELKYVVYLKGWPSLLKQQAANRGNVILLDHGPVFRLATLLEFGPMQLRNVAFETWWNQLYRQWALTLDMIIWLDTSDPILVDRINRRNQGHEMKGKGISDTQPFLTRYRMSYLRTLDKMKTYKEPILLHFNTNQASVEQIADAILVACRSKLNGN